MYRYGKIAKKCFFKKVICRTIHDNILNGEKSKLYGLYVLI